MITSLPFTQSLFTGFSEENVLSLFFFIVSQKPVLFCLMRSSINSFACFLPRASAWSKSFSTSSDALIPENNSFNQLHFFTTELFLSLDSLRHKNMKSKNCLLEKILQKVTKTMILILAAATLNRTKWSVFLSQKKNKDTIGLFFGWNLKLYKYIWGWIIFYSIFTRNL